MIVLPGLYVALLAVLLGWALRRWWDPIPARVWAVFALLLLALFGPALFLGRVLLPVDILPGLNAAGPGAAPQGNRLQLDLVTQIVPLQHQVRRAYAAGEWPLWNDLVGAGMPLLADPQSQAVQPLVLLAAPLPLPQAVGVTAALRVLFALVFTFLLLRRQELSEGASLFGGVAFALCGFLLLWLSWPIGNSSALLPLVLYATLMTAARGARRDFVLLIAALVALLAGGHPESIVYVAIVGGLFAAARLRSSEGRFGLMARWLCAGGAALALAAPVLAPALRFAPQTLRHQLVAERNQGLAKRPPLAGWRTPQERRETRVGVVKRALSVVAPNAFGNSRYDVYWGDNSANEDGGAFVGGAALLAALLVVAPTARRFPQERLFMATAAASLLIAVRIPGVPWALSAVPILNQSISANRRLLLIVAFSLAYLAACAIERWRAGDGPQRWIVAVAAAALLGLVAWAYLQPPAVEAGLPARWLWRWLWMSAQLAAVGGAAMILLFTGVGARRAGTAGSDLRLWLLTALAAGELLLVHGPANPALPRAGYYPPTPTIQFLQERAFGFRVAGIGDRLLANSPAVYGLADIRISNPIAPYRYLMALAPVSASVRATEQILVEPEHPLYQLLGVRYAIAPPRMRSVPGWRAVSRDSTARIFERAKALPRLFLPAAAMTNETVAWTEWLAANDDFAARALVDIVPEPGGAWIAEHPAASALELSVVRPSRVTAFTRLPERRLVASSIYQDGGWRLLVDHRRQPATTANGPFAAAWIPAGEHRLDWVYRAPGFLFGLALAALASAGLLAWMAARPR